MTKTFKRETAIGMFLFLLVLCVFDLTSGGTTGAFRWAELLALPIFGFAGVAFGLDAAAKQLPIGPKAPPATQPPEGFAE
ncbi:hypothetical protein [Roseibium sp.]|uniref:hypothetical protein n=1 Tax=Roseibium sp. TaxID=1936156 RepID=UPI003B516793